MRRCSGCGAEVPRPEALFCERCGAALEESPARAAVGLPPPDPLRDIEARFRALAAHPDLAAHLAARPDVPELAGRVVPSLLALVMLSILGFLAAFVCFQVCPPLGFLPLALVGVGALALARQMLWNARTPLVARPAAVVELRAKLDAGARHSPAHTRHFATLRFEDGTGAEHESYPSALPGLEPGALGVAYLKGERLAAFTRFPL